MDRVRNEEARGSAGLERELESRVDQRILRRFGLWTREGNEFYRKARRVLMAGFSGGWVRYGITWRGVVCRFMMRLK